MTEIFCFFEMSKADSSRIELMTLPSAEPYARMEISALQEPGDQQLDQLNRSVRALASSTQHFDVRVAVCAYQADQDRLLSVIESCGAGFDSFNAWMHNLLIVKGLEGLPSPRVRQAGHTSIDGVRRVA